LCSIFFLVFELSLSASFLIFYEVLFAGTTPGRDGILFTKQLYTRMSNLLKLLHK